MATVGVPLLAVTVLHASTFTVSALTATAYLPWLIFGLPAGAWVDRLPAREVMIACDVISALLYGSIPIAAWANVLTMPQVLAVLLLAGAADIFFSTAYQVYLPVMLAREDLIEGNAKLQGSRSFSSISGPGLAGLAADAVGQAAALLFNAGSFLVSAACLLAIRVPQQKHSEPARKQVLGAEIRDGLRYLWRDPLLRRLAIFPATANFAYGGVLSISIPFLIRAVHLGASTVGLLIAGGSVGGLIGAMTVRSVADRIGTARTVLYSTVAAGLSGLLIPLTESGLRVIYYIIASVIVNASVTAVNIILSSFRQRYCPGNMLGRAVASQRFLIYGTAPIGALLAGTLGSNLGLRPALWILLSAFALSGAFLLTRPILANRDLPEYAPDLDIMLQPSDM